MITRSIDAAKAVSARLPRSTSTAEDPSRGAGMLAPADPTHPRAMDPVSGAISGTDDGHVLLGSESSLLLDTASVVGHSGFPRIAAQEEA